MGLLRLLGVPEGMTASEARKLQKLAARGIAPETAATDTKTTAELADAGDIEVTT